ncbi:photosynthetic reaction center cytochrome PufC [Sphingomonas jaspsi]|uniref:photosynthetic reaction center cytochrome PufC n=1 Tax=Sphingomonas jaspsi TaxID=392409 RepID=UPI0004B7CA24|nr:photosynthetic reaction center cytochrome PufC [Sphingomonas jaspsi]
MTRAFAIALIAALPLTVTACDLKPKEATQNGYRGTGMDTIKDAASAVAADVPAPPYAPPPETGAMPAPGQYKNLQVLGDLSDEQLSYTMASITQWVAPKEGCNYCHNPANMASDELYTKVVARRMLQMTRAINQGWTNHVGQTGVTCYTCHRGQHIPTEHWTLPAADPTSIVGNRHGQNNPVSNSAYSSLPNAALASYLQGLAAPEDIRVVSKTARPTPADRVSVKQTEATYAMMAHITSALGVNCTYCHNAQSFQSWATSNPPRQTAWYGVRMVRDLNGHYLTPLAGVLPANRKGEAGDPFKINCATCHQGQNKPLGGVAMSKDYPSLRKGAYQQAAAPMPAPPPIEAGAKPAGAR